jgi:hypothetical protein
VDAGEVGAGGFGGGSMGVGVLRGLGSFTSFPIPPGTSSIHNTFRLKSRFHSSTVHQFVPDRIHDARTSRHMAPARCNCTKRHRKKFNGTLYNVPLKSGKLGRRATRK